MQTAYCCTCKELNLRKKTAAVAIFFSNLILWNETLYLAMLIAYLNITKYPLLKEWVFEHELSTKKTKLLNWLIQCLTFATAIQRLIDSIYIARPQKKNWVFDMISEVTYCLLPPWMYHKKPPTAWDHSGDVMASVVDGPAPSYSSRSASIHCSWFDHTTDRLGPSVCRLIPNCT